MDFRPRLSRAAPPGFLADGGLAYRRARGYGWLAMPGPQDGFERLEPPGLGIAARSGLSVPLGSVWAMDIPSGTYQLTIAVGDPAASRSSRFQVAVEGKVVGEFQPGQKAPAVLSDLKVAVADGQLTIELGPKDRGGRAEINFLTIRRAR